MGSTVIGWVVVVSLPTNNFMYVLFFLLGEAK